MLEKPGPPNSRDLLRSSASETPDMNELNVIEGKLTARKELDAYGDDRLAGCPDCVRLAAELRSALARHDASEATDCRVLMRRHATACPEAEPDA